MPATKSELVAAFCESVEDSMMNEELDVDCESFLHRLADHLRELPQETLYQDLLNAHVILFGGNKTNIDSELDQRIASDLSSTGPNEHNAYMKSTYLLMDMRELASQTTPENHRAEFMLQAAQGCEFIGDSFMEAYFISAAEITREALVKKPAQAHHYQIH